MVQGPPSSDSEGPSDVQDVQAVDVYQYESEGEEMLGSSARSLYRRANGDYRLARAALLAYTRVDLVYLPPPTTIAPRAHVPSQTAPAPRPTAPFHTPTLCHTSPPAPRPFLRTRTRPSVSQTTTARLLTPPPPSVSRPPPVMHVTADPPSPGVGSAGSPSDEDDVTGKPRVSNQQNPPLAQPFSSSPSKPRNQHLTAIYPLLVKTDMLGYFKIEDGVSYRSSEDVQAILTRIRQDEEWLGESTHVDTTAVGSDNPILIHRPTPTTTAGMWYAVTAGTQVGVFTSWEQTASYTQGVSCAVYRGWRSRAGAYRSLQLAVVLGTVRLLPHPRS